MWFVCASVSVVVSHEDSTVYMLFVRLCVQQGDDVHVCWSVSELEATWLSLAWFFAHMFSFFFFFHSPDIFHEKKNVRQLDSSPEPGSQRYI